VSLSSAAAREPTRRQWQWRMERRAATVPAAPEASQNPSLQFLEFEGLFCNF